MKVRYVVLAVVLLGWLWPNPASAHANLVRSNPAANAVIATAPAALDLTFSEPLERGSKASVSDSQGRSVDQGDSTILAEDKYSLRLGLQPLPDGVYTVQWLTISSADGHSLKGTFAFAIGDTSIANAPLILPPVATNPLSTPPLQTLLLRWLTVLALTLVGGALAWAEFLGGPHEPPTSRRRFERWQQATIVLGTLLGLLVTGLSLWQAQQIASVSVSQLITSRAGTVLGIRLVLFALLLGLTLLSKLRGRWLIALLALWSATAMSVSMFGHSAVNSRLGSSVAWVVLSLSLDWIHLAATAFWIGGLWQMFGLYWALRSASSEQRLQHLSTSVPRFSTIGLSAVLALTATGLYSAWQHIGGLEQLWTTSYGRSLLFKLVLFGLMLCLGLINRQWITPRLDSAEPSPVAARLLKRSISIELGLGFLILILVGSLTSLPPSRDLPQNQGFVAYARAADLDLTLQVVPASSGQYTIAVTVDGLPADSAPARVLLRSSMASHNMEANQTELTLAEPGRWGTRGSFLSMVGTWQFEIIVRAPNRDDVRHMFDVDTIIVDSAARPPIALRDRLSLPLSMQIAFGLLAVALLVAATGSWFANGLPQGRWRWAAQGLVFVSFLTCVVPFYLGQALTPSNPYEPTVEVLTQGKALYEKNCLPCHGITGKGNGPAARSLPVPPADFTQPHFITHPESILYGWVKGGIPGRGMPAFGENLSSKEIWQVLTYINDLNRQAATANQPAPATTAVP